MKLRIRQSKYAVVWLCAASFVVTFAVIFLLYAVQGFAPFGDLSLATRDASNQYLDLFAYLKDVLSGANRISYTFSRGLGGSGIAVFSYYLSSPLSLLVVFFSKAHLITFFDVEVALKLGVAAGTCALFLRERFLRKLSGIFVLLLSVSYALMQYSIAQSSNIMWLDGAYMLPLMLLGVYYVVRGKRPWLLVISTGCALLFNWYSGGINCIFTVIWFVLEWLLARPEYPIALEERKARVSGTARAVGVYVASMVGGALLSAGLLVPTFLSLASGGRGGLDWALFQNTFNGNNIINVIQNFAIGSRSTEGSVSLFCGSLALLGCIGFFVSRHRSGARKIKVGLILLLSVLIFYYQPFFWIFSMGKEASSFWYRYSYVTIFLIIFIAADYYREIRTERNAGGTLLKCAVGFSALLLLLSWIQPVEEMNHVYYTCFFAIATAGVVALYLRYIEGRLAVRRITMLLMAVLLIVELGLNAHILMGTYSLENAVAYRTYSADQQAQIDQILAADTETYRISQTEGYNVGSDGLRANYDEAFAYHYASIATYTSDPDDRQRTLMNALGYRKNGDNMYIVNTSILGADSLLGVRYILSPYEINGLEARKDMMAANGKAVYANPYALPFALVYDADSWAGDAAYEGDPFTYQNALYSQLLGEDVALYQPIDFTVSDSADSRTYTLSLPEGNYAVYGNIPWNARMDATLRVNAAYTTAYSCWLSPSVFYIPTADGDTSATVELRYDTGEIAEEQFYALDLDMLADVSARLNARAAGTSSVEGNSARFEVTAEAGDSLFLSVPYQNGWTITRDGEVIEPEMFADCLLSIPLTEGENVIEMRFCVSGWKVGISCSAIGVAVLAIFMVCGRRKRLAQNAGGDD